MALKKLKPVYGNGFPSSRNRVPEIDISPAMHVNGRRNARSCRSKRVMA
jgi:hypothetical protein